MIFEKVGVGRKFYCLGNLYQRIQSETKPGAGHVNCDMLNDNQEPVGKMYIFPKAEVFPLALSLAVEVRDFLSDHFDVPKEDIELT